MDGGAELKESFMRDYTIELEIHEGHGGQLRTDGTSPDYEKVIDPDGVTTEFVRCLDPTASGIVMKVTRTALSE